MATETAIQNATETERDVEPTRTGQVFRPNVDILENEEELLILADMPGSSSPDIDVKFEDGSLTILGRVTQRQRDETSWLLHEYGVGDFYRVFQVSEAIDATRISAEYVEGVLKLHLPKVAAVKPRKIEVQAK